jgi:outer membrane protein OmpA-like peptidoglycan-associated protein
MNAANERRRGRPLLARGVAIMAMLVLAYGVANAAEDVSHIELAPGLVSVSASHFDGQDYEVVRVVTAMDDETVTFGLHRSAPTSAGSTDRETLYVTRIVRRVDLESANRINAYFHTEDPPLFPGSTAFQASAKLLAGLKAGGETPLVFGMAAGPLGIFGARKYYRGNLKRIEPAPVPVSLLLNGQPTTLPTIHAKGTLAVGGDVGEGEFWWLDQPDNALALRWTFKDTVVHVVRIDTPRPPAGSEVGTVASALASEACRAELHGVYFDTGSAALLAESATAIDEIASVLQRQAEWQVVIEGHTDAMGTEADNQRLSQARADAVREALVETHGIAADRLISRGFGEARPIDTNETVEGRARNRRVELSRPCT